jgi:hypothetical protein
VFKKSLQNMPGTIDMETAEMIVNNAVKRVLDPESMRDVPMLDREKAVVDAFRGCLERSQAPPRNVTPSTSFATTSRTGIGGPSTFLVSTPLSSGPAAPLTTTASALNSTGAIRPTAPAITTVSSSAGIAQLKGIATTPPTIPTPSNVLTVQATVTDSTAAAITVSKLAAALDFSNGVASPKPPPVETLTPPDTTQKRGIDAVTEVEEPAAKKVILKDAVASVLDKKVEA